MATPIWDRVTRWTFLCGLILVVLVGAAVAVTGVHVVDAKNHGIVVDDSGDVVRTVGAGPHYVMPGDTQLETMPRQAGFQNTIVAYTPDEVRVVVEYRLRVLIPPSAAAEIYQQTGGRLGVLAHPVRECVTKNLTQSIETHNSTTLFANFDARLKDPASACSTDRVMVQVTATHYSGTPDAA